MFRHLRDILSGRIAHFNDVSEPVLNELWNNLANLESANRLVFKHFIVAAARVAESLLLPDRRPLKSLRIDVKKLTAYQLRRLHCVLLSYFTFVFYTINPLLTQDVERALFELTEAPELTNSVLRSLCKIGKIQFGDPREHHMFRVVSTVWGHVVAIIGHGSKHDIAHILYFLGISHGPLLKTLENIKLELNP